MTTLTAAAGLTPLSIIGGVLFRPLALTIIFGLLFSTMLTLIVVPSFYTVMAKIKEKRKMKKTAKSIESDHPSYDI